jgi:N-acetylneuraminate synthase
MGNKVVRVGERMVGPGHPCYVIAEIGINHNGSLETAKQLIDVAVESGCDAVKFQKRTVDVVYTADELARPRENPFGPTNGDLKRALEFGHDAYREIDRHCRTKGIAWFASCWDEASVDFIEKFEPPCYKIASASLTDDALLRHHAAMRRPIILSTGMSTIEQIQHAAETLATDDLILLHCNSTYPAKLEELNLRALQTFQRMFEAPVGYSGHEVGLPTTLAAVALGAAVVERHVTLDRAMWGSDQAASLEPAGLKRLVRDIRAIERALGDGIKCVWESERSVMAKLRRVG